jgi:lysyl-tRNA synthetase class 2
MKTPVKPPSIAYNARFSDIESAGVGQKPEGEAPADFVDFVSQLGFRDRLLRQLREYFHGHGFLEVQPPCLSRDCVIDAYLDPLCIATAELGVAEASAAGSSSHYFLQTSAESAMKRLLARGAPSIFAISPVFRQGESGARHNVEFTMLEWYEVGGDAASAIALLGNLAAEVFATERFETISYQEAFVEQLGLDPIETPIERLSQRVADLDAELAASIGEDRDGLLDVLLSHLIEPHLGNDVPTILTRYPTTQAALARPCEDDPRFAHRFELFYHGLELANGYDELQDADELVRRYEINNQIRRRCGRGPLPVETTLVAAMRQGLPKCSGVAVGVDRLQMLISGAKHINEVIPLPITEA